MNRIIHFDISADEPEKVAKFYTDVFGWDIKKWETPPMSDEGKAKMRELMPDIKEEDMDTPYWLITTGPESEPGINGGLSKRMSEAGSGKAFVNTIGVEDLEKMMEKIISAGGEIVRKKMPIPGMGWFAQAKDPDGNYFGIMEEDKSAKF